MILLVVGTEADARGFALAGVEARAASDAARAAEIVKAESGRNPDLELVLLSGALATPERGRRARDRRGATGPAVVLLPGSAPP